MCRTSVWAARVSVCVCLRCMSARDIRITVAPLLLSDNPGYSAAPVSLHGVVLCESGTQSLENKYTVQVALMWPIFCIFIWVKSGCV